MTTTEFGLNINKEGEFLKTIHFLSIVLVVGGALNWGLVGLLGINFVNIFIGTLPMFEKLVYLLIGLSGVYLIVKHKEACVYCGGEAARKTKTRRR